MASQIEPTDFLKSLIVKWGILSLRTSDDLMNMRDNLYHVLVIKPYNDETKNAEHDIRWKRTGSQVLEDGYVYQGKACTDIVVAFLALVRTAGVPETRFVKLKNNATGMVHSVAEIRLPDSWYIFDVANTKASPVKGEIQPNVPWGSPPNGPYVVWKKGRDAWDLGLTEFDTIEKIKVK